MSNATNSMLCNWRLWVDCNDERASHKILRRVGGKLGREPADVKVERTDEGQVVSFVVELASESWNDAVVEAIALGQRIADRWSISSGSSMRDDVAAGAQRLDLFRIAGIKAASWEIDRKGSS